MTQEDFKTYSELQVKFAKDVFRVVGFLKEIDPDLKFVDEFQLLDDGSVKTHGWEYGVYQYQEEHYGFFDSEMLTWTDDELKKYVEQIKNGKEEERVREEIEKAKKKEEEERRIWERLNEKFGKK
jgi:predicted SAM-dependent methyltransferase